MTSESPDERGAILPIFALLIIVLLMFAALTVDLGAAWAQRRQNQSAADAGVLAGALIYLDVADPHGADIVASVQAFVDDNLAGTPDWSGCVDDEPGFIPLEGIDCISINSIGGPTTLRVRIPAQLVETSFARIIGIDTISVDAFAEASIKVKPTHKIIPFSLPANPDAEECLGVPPDGHNPDDLGPCDDGSDSGNFGLLDSPWFGRPPPDDTGDVCEGKQQTIEKRTEHNIAMGGDHEMTVWADDAIALPPIGTDSRNHPEGLDSCASVEADPSVTPYILHTELGTEVGNAAILSDGMIGPAAYGSPAVPGRLRQAGGLNVGGPGDTINFSTAAPPGYEVDNIGLWEYLTGGCPGADFSTTTGTDRTTAMTNCLELHKPQFSMSILDSPRFALVPELNYSNLTGDGWFGIRKLVPVYIQTTWYDCTISGELCLFHPEHPTNVDPTLPAYHYVFFNPGEGTESPCYKKKPDDADCEIPSKISLRGVTAYVLGWDALPKDAQNALGNPTPFEVYLSR